MNSRLQQQQAGFALLLTLIIVSVVLSIGLTLLNITLKQFTLSVTGRESEVAFHTAGAMLECILQYRQDDVIGPTFINPVGGPSNLDCGSEQESSRTFANDISPAGGSVYHHFYQYDYSTGGGACGEMSVYIFDADSGDINNYAFTGEGLERGSCSDGNVCTFAFARGFNRACGDLNSLRTVQREFSVRF